jgi:histidinol-phosphate aminotransferase
MAVRVPRSLIRPLVQRLHAYVPGEQPKIPGLIKLNTNENPYPPSPKVLAAVKAAVDGRLRLYPNPTASALREKLAKLHGCAPENIIVGNGSDELLALATRTFVEPVAADMRRRTDSNATESASSRRRLPEAMVQFFSPSYSLYPVLAEIAGAHTNAVPLNADFTLPALSALPKQGWDFKAALSLITTPNAPSGRGFSTAELDALSTKSKGVVVLDEAYVDFARENAMALALKHPQVLVSRTFSKAYSLCFQRVGYFVGHADLIAALDKVRDSYNVNGLGQIAALATLDDLPHYRRNFRRIIATREQVTRELTGLGWTVLPSQTNFLLARPPRFPAEEWLAKLRARKLLVRWFKYPEVRDYLRITIGSEAEMKTFVRTARTLVAAK